MLWSKETYPGTDDLPGFTEWVARQPGVSFTVQHSGPAGWSAYAYLGTYGDGSRDEEADLGMYSTLRRAQNACLRLLERFESEVELPDDGDVEREE